MTLQFILKNEAFECITMSTYMINYLIHSFFFAIVIFIMISSSSSSIVVILLTLHYLIHLPIGLFNAYVTTLTVFKHIIKKAKYNLPNYCKLDKIKDI